MCLDAETTLSSTGTKAGWRKEKRDLHGEEAKDKGFSRPYSFLQMMHLGFPLLSLFLLCLFISCVIFWLILHQVMVFCHEGMKLWAFTLSHGFNVATHLGRELVHLSVAHLQNGFILETSSELSSSQQTINRSKLTNHLEIKKAHHIATEAELQKALVIIPREAFWSFEWNGYDFL